MTVERVGVIGAGLIGTSLGLALGRAGQQVVLVDRDAEQARTAAALGAGEAVSWDGLAGCDHVVVAVPPGSIGAVLEQAARGATRATFSDVASTKGSVLLEVETLALDQSSFCGGHPIAGRERGGPTAAVPELFDDTVWVLTPSSRTSDRARADVAELARRCGARPVEMSAATHDQALGVVSHAAQVVASVLAAQLAVAGPTAGALAGSGFRDTTRLADSDPALWSEIALGNRAALAEALQRIRADLGTVADGLTASDPGPLTALMQRGRAARMSLPGKAGRSSPTWSRVGVVLQDRPGELARLFAVAGDAGVNIEDITIDHAAEHPVGLVGLDIAEHHVPALRSAVGDAGWHTVELAPRRS